MRWSLALLLTAALAAPASVAADSSDGGVACTVPASTAGLVLGIHRIYLPMKQPEREERSEVTFDGTCTPQIDCVRVTEPEFQKLLPLVHATQHPRIDTTYVSPHYGWRAITVQWTGGSCTIVDAHGHLIDERDRSRFYQAFDAIGELAVAHHRKKRR